MGILTVLTTLLGIGGSALENYQKRQQQAAENSAAIAEAETKARIAMLEKAQNAEVSWDNLAADQARTSWKDEWFTLLLSAPLILAFIGEDGRRVVTQGFAALESMPSWYVTMLSLAVAFAFGYRKLVETITSFRTPVVRR